ncbi:MAG: isoleucine--tRNA ligase [Planctomycetes bacterium]|nr:isoleucine--tRNA ligase [Planctomycetota bacterium]
MAQFDREKKKKGYRETLNLPQTSFPMKANLVQKEPEIQRSWSEIDIYRQIRLARAGTPRFILHDGPPYATGDLHVGTGLNKVLKDFVVRQATMSGFDSPFRPGWDCHGLPIEWKVREELGKAAARTPVPEMRRQCLAYAMKFFQRNREDFKRLGVLGSWDRPYLTVDYDYEAGILDLFADLVEKGYVYRALRPIHWDWASESALAEAELEYQDITSPSIFVRFPLVDDLSSFFGLDAEVPIDVLIWTTTPWTLPANLAIAVHPEFSYTVVEYTDSGRTRRRLLLAEKLVEKVMGQAGAASFTQHGRVPGRALCSKHYRHVFMDRVSRIVPATYVTLTEGTGCVHTAPGHGREDFYTGQEHGLPPLSPVNSTGHLTPEAGPFAGLHVLDADPRICQFLAGQGTLFHRGEIRHSYPHSWRSHKPVIFRATEQWFIRIDHRDLRARTLRAIDALEWVPPAGQARIRSMVEMRPDWCISRQRCWGVPIPAFYCPKTRQVLLSPAVIRHVRDLIAGHGTDIWFTWPARDLVPPGTRVGESGPEELVKETDIFDVWFESGASHRSVLRRDPALSFPAAMYLEGSDQHRGWFQVSLLTAMAADEMPPFGVVTTHGFVVDEGGRKMSKSGGNFISTAEATSAVGADLFRLWVASNNYHNDIPTSLDLIRWTGEAYFKIRNTFRFLLGNLYDFDPARNGVALSGPEHRDTLDRWALAALHELIREVLAAYGRYEYHGVYRRVHDFCVVQLSNWYLNSRKDRLYCDAPDSPRRRRAQTVMHEILESLTRLVAPILVHTAEEVWRHIPCRRDAHLPSIHLALFPKAPDSPADAEVLAEWSPVLETLEPAARRELEEAKTKRGLSNPLDAEVVFHVQRDSPWSDRLDRLGPEIEDLLGVGFHRVEKGAEPAGTDDLPLRIEVRDTRNIYARCERSWKRRPDVGCDPRFPDVSARDAQVLAALHSSA